MLKRSLLLLLLAGSSFAWWDTTFPYRTQVNISSPAPLSDYPVRVNIANLVYNNTGLAGSWHFSEGAGTRAADSSGNSNDGTLLYGPAWKSGSGCTFGSCLSFDGVNDYVSLPSISPASLTVSAWVKADAYAAACGGRGIVEKGEASGYANYALLYYGTYFAVKIRDGPAHRQLQRLFPAFPMEPGITLPRLLIAAPDQ